MQIIESLSPEAFLEEINDPETIVIDIRTQEEREHFGIIEHTDLHIDMHTETFFWEILQLEREKKYLIYCWHANRTGYLLSFMAQNGFEYVKDLYWWTELWEMSWYKFV